MIVRGNRSTRWRLGAMCTAIALIAAVVAQTGTATADVTYPCRPAISLTESSGTITARWTPVVGASEYQLRYRRASDNKYTWSPASQALTATIPDVGFEPAVSVEVRAKIGSWQPWTITDWRSPSPPYELVDYVNDIGINIDNDDHDDHTFGKPCVTDLDGDGLDDIVWSNHYAAPWDVYYRQPDGTYIEDTATGWPSEDNHGCAVGDLNNDGLPDIYGTLGGCKGTCAEADELWIQQTDGTFTNQASQLIQPAVTYDRSRVPIIFDADGDGDPDILVTATGGGQVQPSHNRLLINDDGMFVETVAGLEQAGLGVDCATAADFDQDGDSDVVICRGEATDWYRNEGTGEFEPHDFGPGSLLVRAVEFQDVNGDVFPDLILLTDTALQIRLGSDGTYGAVDYSHPVVEGRDLALPDLDGDGLLDVYVMAEASDQMPSSAGADYALRNLGNLNFERLDARQSRRGSADSVAVIPNLLNSGKDGVLVANGYFSFEGDRQVLALHDLGLPPPVDGDGDGWFVPMDCDDGDDTINPGAIDVAGNGIDEDCDGADAVPPLTAVSVSSTSSWTGSGTSFQDEDIATWDPATGLWSMTLDGSTIGLTSYKHDIDAFDVGADGVIVFSITADATLAPLGVVDASDLVAFDPTTGALAMVLDGSDVGLTTSGENINAVSVRPDGSILFSTTGSYVNAGKRVGVNEDVFRYEPVTGEVSLFFDGSDTGYTGNITGASLNGPELFYSSGSGSDRGDVFSCIGAVFGADTNCEPTAVTFDCDTTGLATESLDGVQYRGPEPVDDDGDGWFVPTDCDDGDDTINPGAIDVAGNGIDEDCDGEDAIAVPAPTAVSVSSTSSWTGSGTSFQDEDIATWDPATGLWSMTLDGSTIGLTSYKHDIDAFDVGADGVIVFSITADATLAPLGVVDASDLVAFDPTTGALAMVLDGSDVGLTTSGENINAVSVRPDGSILFSTTGSYVNAGKRVGVNQDVFRYEPVTGEVSLFFDGSDTGYTGNITGASLDDPAVYYISASSRHKGDVFSCIGAVFGADTNCEPTAVAFDHATTGLATEILDGLHVSSSPRLGDGLSGSFGPTRATNYTEGPS